MIWKKLTGRPPLVLNEKFAGLPRLTRASMSAMRMEGLLDIYTGFEAPTGRKRGYARKPMMGGLSI